MCHTLCTCVLIMPIRHQGGACLEMVLMAVMAPVDSSPRRLGKSLWYHPIREKRRPTVPA